MEKTRWGYEFIFGGRWKYDLTYKLLKELAVNDPRLSVVRLRRHFGQAATSTYMERFADFYLANWPSSVWCSLNSFNLQNTARSWLIKAFCAPHGRKCFRQGKLPKLPGACDLNAKSVII
jgi:hypothetical protein